MPKARLRETGKVTTTESSDIKVLEISDEQLAKINQQTLVPYSKEQVFAFSVLLIDDAPTRNSTQYPESFQRTILSKEPRKGNWIGLTMLMGEAEDHETKARNQKARIFDARLVQTPKGHVGTIGEAYIPINAHTEGFIESIKAGIHREVSIGVAVSMPSCSICKEDIRECEHSPGEMYGGEPCTIVMKGDAEAQEVSFVAVPGSYHAQILSDTNGYIPLSEALGKGIIKKEGKRMKKKKKDNKFSELSNDISNLMKMLEKKLEFSEDQNDDDEEDDEDVDAQGNDSGSDDDDDDTRYESADDSDDSDDSDDDKDEFAEADDDDDDDDDDEDTGNKGDSGEDDDEEDDDSKQTESLNSIFKSLRKMNEKFDVLQEQASNGRMYHKQVLKETLRLGVLSKTIPVQSKETFKKTFEKLSLKELLEFQKGYKVEVERLYPSTGKAIALTENKEEKVQYSKMDVSDIVKEFKN